MPFHFDAPDPILTPQPSGPGPTSPHAVTIPSSPAGDLAASPAHWTLLEWLGYSALVLVAVLLTIIALTTLWWMLHAWRSRESLTETAFAAKPRAPQHSFTLLVPGRHEEEVMGQTLDTLARQTHPNFEIIAIVGEDDPGTERVAREAAERHPGVISVIVDDSVPKNKPRALNRALQHSKGDIVGVFDAEDDVHPELLTLVDSRFSETGADVVQGGVQLMNFGTSWWALQNVLEYYFWFRSRLHFHARSRFIPLGGNTVFVRAEWLYWSEGWDAECLAEDCELGVRLSSAGARVAVAYSPEVVTREETPGSLASLFRQRTRWDQGYLQVLGKGEWKGLPHLKARLFARYLLSMPFLQAATGLLIPVSIIIAFTVKVPTIVALLTFIPLAPTLITVAVQIAGLSEFGKLYGQRVRVRDYVRLVLGTFPYQVFLGVAALRSVFRQLRGINAWEKTAHAGLHRPGAAASAQRESSPALAMGNAASAGGHR